MTYNQFTFHHPNMNGIFGVWHTPVAVLLVMFNFATRSQLWPHPLQFRCRNGNPVRELSVYSAISVLKQQ